MSRLIRFFEKVAKKSATMLVLLGDENEPERNNFSEKELKNIDEIKKGTNELIEITKQAKDDWDKID